MKCAECDCEYGDENCNWIKTDSKEYTNGYIAGLNAALKIADDVYNNGEYFGDAEYDNCTSIYQQGALEVFETIDETIRDMETDT